MERQERGGNKRKGASLGEGRGILTLSGLSFSQAHTASTQSKKLARSLLLIQ